MISVMLVLIVLQLIVVHLFIPHALSPVASRSKRSSTYFAFQPVTGLDSSTPQTPGRSLPPFSSKVTKDDPERMVVVSK